MPCDGCDSCQCGERLTQKLELPDYLRAIATSSSSDTPPQRTDK